MPGGGGGGGRTRQTDYAVVERHSVAPTPCPREGGSFGRAAGCAGSRAAGHPEELGTGWLGLSQPLSTCVLPARVTRGQLRRHDPKVCWCFSGFEIPERCGVEVSWSMGVQPTPDLATAVAFSWSLGKEECTHPWFLLGDCMWVVPSPHWKHFKTPALQQNGSPARRGAVGRVMAGAVGNVGSKP